MKKIAKNSSGGFIQMVLIVVGALVALKYVYDIDVIGFLTTGSFKEWLDKIYAWGSEGWIKYRVVIIKIWNFVFDLVKGIAAKF